MMATQFGIVTINYSLSTYVTFRYNSWSVSQTTDHDPSGRESCYVEDKQLGSRDMIVNTTTWLFYIFI